MEVGDVREEIAIEEVAPGPVPLSGDIRAGEIHPPHGVAPVSLYRRLLLPTLVLAWVLTRYLSKVLHHQRHSTLARMLARCRSALLFPLASKAPFARGDGGTRGSRRKR